MKKLLFIFLFAPLSMSAQLCYTTITDGLNDITDGLNDITDGQEYTCKAVVKRLNVYPNPTTDFVTVEGLESDNTEGVLFDAVGRRVRPFALERNGLLDLSDLSQGVFVAILRGGFSFKIVKI